MTKFKTNLSKFPKALLAESELLLKDNNYKVAVITDHGLTVNFNDEGKEVTTSLVFNTEGNLINYTCSCNKYSLCKHVGAALTLLDENKSDNLKRTLSIDVLLEEYNFVNKYFHTDKEFLDFFNNLTNTFSKTSIVDTFVGLFKNILQYNNGYFLFKFFSALSKPNLPNIFNDILEETLDKVITYLNNSIPISKTLESYLDNFFQDICLEYAGNQVLGDLCFKYLDKEIIHTPSIYQYLVHSADSSSFKSKDFTLRMIDNLSNYDESYYLFSTFPVYIIRYFVEVIYREASDITSYLLKLASNDFAFSLDCTNMFYEIFTLVINEYNDLKNGEVILNQVLIDDPKAAYSFIANLNPTHKEYLKNYILEKSGIYSYYVITRDKSCIDTMLKSESPISLTEIKKLISSDFNFITYRNFFDNKEILKEKDGENLNKNKVLETLNTITSTITNPTFIKKISDLILNDASLLEVFKNQTSFNYIPLCLKLNILESIGFKKI